MNVDASRDLASRVRALVAARRASELEELFCEKMEELMELLRPRQIGEWLIEEDEEGFNLFTGIAAPAIRAWSDETVAKARSEFEHGRDEVGLSLLRRLDVALRECSIGEMVVRQLRSGRVLHTNHNDITRLDAKLLMADRLCEIRRYGEACSEVADAIQLCESRGRTDDVRSLRKMLANLELRRTYSGPGGAELVAEEIRVLQQLAHARRVHEIGQYDLSNEVLSAVLTSEAEIHDRWRAHFFGLMANNHYRCGNHATAEKLYERARELCQSVNDELGTAVYYENVYAVRHHRPTNGSTRKKHTTRWGWPHASVLTLVGGLVLAWGHAMVRGYNVDSAFRKLRSGEYGQGVTLWESGWIAAVGAGLAVLVAMIGAVRSATTGRSAADGGD